MTRRTPHLLPSLRVALAMAAPTVLAAALWQGVPGLLGGLLGAALAVASFAASAGAVAWAETIAVKLTLPVALFAYAGKLVLYGVTFAALARAEWQGLVPAALSLGVVATAWVVGQAIWTYRAKLPYVELGEDAGVQ